MASHATPAASIAQEREKHPNGRETGHGEFVRFGPFPCENYPASASRNPDLERDSSERTVEKGDKDRQESRAGYRIVGRSPHRLPAPLGLRLSYRFMRRRSPAARRRGSEVAVQALTFGSAEMDEARLGARRVSSRA